MKLGNQELDRASISRRVGAMTQLGGARHYQLSDGKARGIRAIDIDTAAGLRFTVLADRGMDISQLTYKGANLVYHGASGEVHPAYYDARGLEWLRGFFAGLLTTCGLTHLGHPATENDEELGLHGRVTHIPARQVVDLSRWEGDEFIVETRGVVEEAALWLDQVRMTRTIATRLGARSFTLRDEIENFGFAPAPLTIVYHINIGWPLLDDGAEYLVTSDDCEPFDGASAAAKDDRRRLTGPTAGAAELNYQHHLKTDADGRAYSAVVNRALGLGLAVMFDARALPHFNQWKMMGEGTYCAAIEPGNVPVLNRPALRERGLLPELAPGETRETSLEFRVLEGAGEIDAFCEMVEKISAA